MGAILAAIIPAITSIFGKVSDDTQAKLNLALQTALANIDLEKAQIAVNAEQAKSDSIFVAGPRPFLEWGCGIALMYNTLGISILNSMFAMFILFGLDPHVVALAKATLPTIDGSTSSMLYQLLGSLMGVSIYPIMDTIKKVNKYKVDNA